MEYKRIYRGIMIIDRKITPYIILDTEPIRNALQKINANEEGLIICVNSSGLLLGVLTDGDFRRWIIESSQPDLEKPVEEIVNQNIISAKVADSPRSIAAKLDQQVQFIPLTDNEGRCVAIARLRNSQILIDHHKIGNDSPCFMIAETCW